VSGSHANPVDYRADLGTGLNGIAMSILAAEESAAAAAKAARPACGALDRRLPPGGALAGRIFCRLIAEPPEEEPLPPGTPLGGWRLDRLLGCGGSAMVYLADRADGQLARQAAIKVVRSDPRLVEQFRRERELLAGLAHPSIARLIDDGTCGDGRPWFAMEHIAGVRIDHYVEQRRLSLHERLVLFEGACEPIAYAHARGLVHRDIKPGNLLVDEEGRPRLLDFGIAMADGAGDDGMYRAMTPIYASPEQRAGCVVAKASDIYQLGMLLGTMLTPEPGLPSRMAGTHAAGALRAVVARATACEPGQRFASVAALRAAVVAIRQSTRLASVRRELGSHRAARLVAHREARARCD
jgi:serine/threonine-protein kinase